MPDYSKSKIYTIRCKTDPSLVYVGATTQILSQRWSCHKRTSITKPHILLYSLINNNWDDFYIELYELFPCTLKIELDKREGELIRQIGNLNQNISGRTRKEYYQENLEKLKETNTKYHQENADKIKERQKIYYNENTEKLKDQNKSYYEQNLETIKEKGKIYRENNLEKIQLYRLNNVDKRQNRDRLYYIDNKERKKENNRIYHQKHREQILERKRIQKLEQKPTTII